MSKQKLAKSFTSQVAHGAGAHLWFFVVISGWEFWHSLDGKLIHRRLAISRSWYSFTYPGRMENWVTLGGKEGHTNIQISAESVMKVWSLWSELADYLSTDDYSFKTRHMDNSWSINSNLAFLIARGFAQSLLKLIVFSCYVFLPGRSGK